MTTGKAFKRVVRARMALDGEAGREWVLVAAETLETLRARYAERIPVSADRTAAILQDLGRRLGELYEVEVDALERTARAIGR